jgi:Arc/MetJ-type ribon-helix-helix transcriptional regulator
MDEYKPRRKAYVSTRWGYEAVTTMISVKIPVALVDGIDRLIQAGLFQSRSDALREAIRMLLVKYGEVALKREPRQVYG